MTRISVVAVVLALLAGCGRQRTPDEIFAEKLAQPRLYLSVKSQTRVVAPANKGAFVDPTTKEQYLPALVCENPECPKRNDKDPFLFVIPDDGTTGCPACAARRDRGRETAAEQRKYDAFVKPYVLPEAKAALDRLERELQDALQREASRKRR